MCPDRKQISYIILRNQVTCLLKIALVSRITVVTKENGLFMLEKRLLFYRKGYDRSEKRQKSGPLYNQHIVVAIQLVFHCSRHEDNA